jgi:hypothetical protein
MLHGVGFLKRWLGGRFGGRDDGAPRREPLPPDEVAFLVCVEANRLAPQALLLCESLRTFGGRYRESAILAVSPRPGLAPGREARARLEALGATCVVEPLNLTGSPYGAINRIVAGAWAERTLPHPYLALLDTDTVLVGEPDLVRADAGVRPVDVKGATSSGAGDPRDAYWARLCRLGGIDLARLPMISTTIDRVRIRASYNAGFTLVRRELGILAATREVFFASLADGLRPSPAAGLDILASTGRVGRVASEWWGSSQAALSVAIWSKTSDVHTYDARYNVPLNNLAAAGSSWPTGRRFAPVLLHYHHLAEAGYRPQLRQVLAKVGCPPRARSWIEERLAYFDQPPLPPESAA